MDEERQLERAFQRALMLFKLRICNAAPEVEAAARARFFGTCKGKTADPRFMAKVHAKLGNLSRLAAVALRAEHLKLTK